MAKTQHAAKKPAKKAAKKHAQHEKFIPPVKTPEHEPGLRISEIKKHDKSNRAKALKLDLDYSTAELLSKTERNKDSNIVYFMCFDRASQKWHKCAEMASTMNKALREQLGVKLS